MSDVEFLQSILNLTRSGSRTVPQSLYTIANSKVGLSEAPHEECMNLFANNYGILHLYNDYYIEPEEVRAMCEILVTLSEEICQRRLN